MLDPEALDVGYWVDLDLLFPLCFPHDDIQGVEDVIFGLVGEGQGYQPVFDLDGVQGSQCPAAELREDILLQVGSPLLRHYPGEGAPLGLLTPDPFAGIPVKEVPGLPREGEPVLRLLLFLASPDEIHNPRFSPPQAGLSGAMEGFLSRKQVIIDGAAFL